MGKSEQGVTNNRYSVIPRVLIFLFDSNGRVLLIRGAKDKKTWAEKINGVGGHVEIGESIRTAAEREFFEETGLTCKNMLFCGQIIVDIGSEPGIALFVFKAEQYTGEIINSKEGSIDWYDMETLNTEELVYDLPVLLQKVSLCHNDSQPFWGYYYYDESDELIMVFN